MQVMEDGRLTDSSSRVVSFKQALIVLTSNVGSTALVGGAAPVGFDVTDGDGDAERLQTLVKDEMKAHFRPEFLNRIDEIVVCFHRTVPHSIVREKVRLTANDDVASAHHLGVNVYTCHVSCYIRRGEIKQEPLNTKQETESTGPVLYAISIMQSKRPTDAVGSRSRASTPCL